MERKPVRRRAAALAEPEAAEAPTSSAAEDAASEAAAETTTEAIEVGAAVVAHGDVCRVGYAPIVRVDAPRREIELCATSEAVDSYGTVFDYEASKAAFARWLGNVREMHERRAVGRRVAVRCDDEARRVYVRVRISAGAADTWAKIADGTLRGASIGASNVVWQRQVRRAGGREQPVQVATAYDLVELSLVDNPSNPDALGITIVRAAEPDIALLAELDEGEREQGINAPERAWGGSAGSRPDGVGRIVGQEAPAGHTGSELRAADGVAPGESLRVEDGGELATAPAFYQPPLPGMAALPLAQSAATVEAPHVAWADGGTEGSGPREGSGERSIGEQAKGVRSQHGVRSTPLRSGEGQRSEHGAGAGDEEERWGSARVETVSTGIMDVHRGEEQQGEGKNAPQGEEQQRALGPFSAEPAGSPDIGVPARAEARPTEGQPAGGNARGRFHAAARGILMGCGCGQCEAALAALGTSDEASADAERGSVPDDARLREAALTRALAASLGANARSVERVEAGMRALGEAVRAVSGTLEGALGELRARVERIEAQPLPGGPALRAVAVEKPSPLAPAAGAQGPVSPAEQYRALESLAGRLSDPQAQIAVAAELIRLRQQEGGR